MHFRHIFLFLNIKSPHALPEDGRWGNRKTVRRGKSSDRFILVLRRVGRGIYGSLSRAAARFFLEGVVATCLEL